MSTADKAYINRNQKKGCTDTYIYKRTGDEMPWYVGAQCLDAMLTFEVRTSDVFLITTAKSGTTWVKRILSLIMNDANKEAMGPQFNSPFSPQARYPEFHHNDHQTVPNFKKYAQMEGRRFIPTHLSPDLLPPQVFEKNPKVIYVARNPKDVAVSLYHHSLQDIDMPSYTWDVFLTNYMQGKGTLFGEWGNHVIPWWERRNEKNVFFVKYEDMITDLGNVVKSLASILEQYHLTEEQLNEITKLCTFDSMKNSPDPAYISICQGWNIGTSKSPFVRKGKVGGWKDFFTVAQNEEFDGVYKRWIGDSGLEMEFTLPSHEVSANTEQLLFVDDDRRQGNDIVRPYTANNRIPRTEKERVKVDENDAKGQDEGKIQLDV
ncbi:sulfotransferase 1B1-like [Glandiceps talaboti]